MRGSGRWGVEDVSEAPEKLPYRPLGDMITKVWGGEGGRGAYCLRSCPRSFRTAPYCMMHCCATLHCQMLCRFLWSYGITACDLDIPLAGSAGCPATPCDGSQMDNARVGKASSSHPSLSPPPPPSHPPSLSSPLPLTPPPSHPPSLSSPPRQVGKAPSGENLNVFLARLREQVGPTSSM